MKNIKQELPPYEEIQSYDKVIDHIKSKKRQIHLLLGNGFSMSYDSKIFSYNALSTFIDNTDNDLLKNLFKIINTKNFESIMQQLENFIEIANVFSTEKDELIKKIKDANETLKNSLIDAIKKLHPEQAFAISDEKSESCVRFLNSFLSNSNNGNVFTTNYDLLLYWVLMRMLNTSDKDKICDGFGRDTEDGELSELRWGKNSGTQSIYYLHGALHLFDTGIEIVKEEYDTQHYLLQKINERMKKKEYPIFVTAGSGDDKLAHIMHNKYLSYCYDKLSAIEGSLIVYGFGFGKYDDHIIKAINKAGENRRDKDGKWHMLHSVYIGLYSKDDYKHINQIKDQFKVPIRVFKAETTNVWGEKKPY